MAPLIDTATEYNLLIDTFKELKIEYVLVTLNRMVAIQLDGIVEFQFDFQGNFLQYITPLT